MPKKKKGRKRKTDKSRNTWARIRTVKVGKKKFIRVGIRKKGKGKRGGKTVALKPHSYRPAGKRSPVQKTKKKR